MTICHNPEYIFWQRKQSDTLSFFGHAPAAAPKIQVHLKPVFRAARINRMKLILNKALIRPCWKIKRKSRLHNRHPMFTAHIAVHVTQETRRFVCAAAEV